MTPEKRHHFVTVILPVIQRYALWKFAGCDPCQREEKSAEAVAAAFVSYVSLVKRGRDEQVTAKNIAYFAVKRVRSGRRVGGSQDKARDVLSNRNGVTVARFGTIRDLPNSMHAALAENARSPVPEQVAFRIDFPAFSAGQPRKKREVAELLAIGNRAKEVSRLVGVSPSRVTQIRRGLQRDWLAYTE
jgi:hypothetical protein